MIPKTGWWRFAAWVFAGALTLFAWLTGFSIGLFLLPFAVFASGSSPAEAGSGRRSSGWSAARASSGS